MSGVHVHAPAPVECRLVRQHCPTCERRTYMVALLYEWYGWHLTCLACGESWEDGERLPRPFAPRWRQCSREAARKAYRKWRGRCASS